MRITENDIDVPIDFVIEYMTSIFIGTLHWWITSETDMTPNHLAQLVIKLVGNGHLTVLGIELENKNTGVDNNFVCSGVSVKDELVFERHLILWAVFLEEVTLTPLLMLPFYEELSQL